MHNGDIPDPLPTDSLGRMLVLSMVFHLLLFGGLVWYNSRSSRLQPLTPTYTVDLVNMPLPAPGSKTDALVESPAKPAAAKPETHDLPSQAAAEPKKSAAKKLPPVSKKPETPVKPVVPPVPPKPEPHRQAAPPPKIAAKPAPPAPKPPAPAPKPAAPTLKHAEPATPDPALKPAASPKKAPVPKAVAEAKPPAAKVKKPAPEAVAPPTRGTDPKARDQQLAQEIDAARKKAAEASRDQDIKDSIGAAQKAVAAKSREQAYKDAVGQAAARLSAGKVSARLSRGSGAGGGSMGPAQVASYGAHVSQTVRRHWQPNCLQRSNMQNLKAVIVVRITADGSIAASWFEKESGDRLFDQSAMTAVTRSSPLPALPPEQEKLEIGITFTPEWKASS